MAPPESDSEACDPIGREFRQHMELGKEALVSISSFRSSSQATGRQGCSTEEEKSAVEVNPSSPKAALHLEIMVW